MQSFEYTIKDPVGLHARPAGLLVKCAKDCSSDIRLKKGDQSADAKRLFAVMGLDVKQSDEITISAEGAEEAADLAKLRQFCENNL